MSGTRVQFYTFDDTSPNSHVETFWAPCPNRMTKVRMPFCPRARNVPTQAYRRHGILDSCAWHFAEKTEILVTIFDAQLGDLLVLPHGPGLQLRKLVRHESTVSMPAGKCPLFELGREPHRLLGPGRADWPIATWPRNPQS